MRGFLKKDIVLAYLAHILEWAFLGRVDLYQ